MKLLAVLLPLILLPTLGFSQTAGAFRYVGTLASWQGNPCNEQAGDIAFASDATPGTNVYLCTSRNTWTHLGILQSDIPVLTFTDGSVFISPATCWFFPTTATATTTLTTLGASNVPVLNTTTNSAAGSVTLQCPIRVPDRLTLGKGATINDVTVFYGIQTSAATSINGAAISSITFPTPGATETPSTVTPAAIPGSVTQSTTTGNLAITTAGAFYSSKLTLGTPFNMSTDEQVLYVTLVFNNTATSVLTVNTPGVIVHYSNTLN
jgi:hypothetical protein